MARLKVRPLKNKEKHQIKLGLFLKTTLVGFLLAIPASANTLLVNEINLERDYQGIGYDDVLMQAAYDAATENGMDQIAVDIHPKDIGTYSALGFVKEGDRRNEGATQVQRMVLKL